MKIEDLTKIKKFPLLKLFSEIYQLPKTRVLEDGNHVYVELEASKAFLVAIARINDLKKTEEVSIECSEEKDSKSFERLYARFTISNFFVYLANAINELDLLKEQLNPQNLSFSFKPPKVNIALSRQMAEDYMKKLEIDKMALEVAIAEEKFKKKSKAVNAKRKRKVVDSAPTPVSEESEPKFKKPRLRK